MGTAVVMLCTDPSTQRRKEGAAENKRMLALLCVALWQTGYFILSFEEYDNFVIWFKPPGSHDQPAVVKSGLPINTVAKGSAATTGQFHELQPSSNKDKSQQESCDTESWYAGIMSFS